MYLGFFKPGLGSQAAGFCSRSRTAAACLQGNSHCAAGQEHKSALVVNLASIAGKSPQPWLSVYSATKAAVLGYTQAMNKELNGDGIKSVAFCPGFVDTDMTDFAKQSVPAEEMIRPEDIAEALRFLLRLSPWAVVPEVIFQRPGETV